MIYDSPNKKSEINFPGVSTIKKDLNIMMKYIHKQKVEVDIHIRFSSQKKVPEKK
jgi:hypothetical protein